MALTLIEASKQAYDGGNVFLSAVISQFAKSSPILEYLPFREIAGNALSYNREETLPGTGFRGINEGFAESTGTMANQTDALYRAGGDLDVDKYIIQTMGADTRSAQEALKIKALSLAWSNVFINGDNSTDAREFNGIKKRFTGTQLISAGSTSGGDALSLNKLDELIDSVEMPTCLIMNKTMRRRLTAAGRNTSVGGFINYTTDSFGRQLTTYADLPILILDEDNNRSKILPFTESGAGGGTAQCTSIYCVSFAEMMLEGIQNGGITARDLGELNDKPVLRTRVEWYSSIATINPRCGARLYGVKDGAITV